jgi:hypothetical protein
VGEACAGAAAPAGLVPLVLKLVLQSLLLHRSEPGPKRASVSSTLVGLV